MNPNQDRPEGAGRNGTVPPAEYRWRPGQSGRPWPGKSTKQWIDLLDEQGLSRAELVKIRDDETAPPTKRTAGERLLRIMESPDMADFRPHPSSALTRFADRMQLDGTMDVVQSRNSWVNIELLKKGEGAPASE